MNSYASYSDIDSAEDDCELEYDDEMNDLGVDRFRRSSFGTSVSDSTSLMLVTHSTSLI